MFPEIVPAASPPAIRELLVDLLHRRELAPPQMRAMMQALMTGYCPEAEAAAFLVALRMKGETILEVAIAAEVLREHMIRWDSGRDDVLDTCGTGGDGQGTFNISTAAALVVAGAGVPVVKHGNRSASSRTSSSADVLQELGVRVDCDAATARCCLERAGLAFCLAPIYHPAMRHVAALRKRLGVPTVFNCLGPLANPAGAPYQLLGVGQPHLLDLLAGALAHLGARQALVVHGEDGLDEVTLAAPTQVRCVRDGRITSRTWTSLDFGLEPCSLEDLRAQDAASSAAMIREVLQGGDGPATRIVLANAAAALLAAEKVPTLVAGVQTARDALSSGRARNVLEALIDATETGGS
jgi:anthranilate phosphoribosyltransferase